MKSFNLILPLIAVITISDCGFAGNSRADRTASENKLPEWTLGGFTRPEGVNPIIKPDTRTKFLCPMQKDSVGWMESDTFNPAATVKDGKICVLFRAEDNSATGIGKRTSRIGLAESTDGIKMEIRNEPVLFPKEDSLKDYDWPGGCEDPRIAVTEDGTYVMLYTSWNRKIPRLCVATSQDLVNWTKHGFAFEKAYEGRFHNLKSKSGSIVTKLDNGRQVITKVNGKYLMYWGEKMINIATSDDLVNWTPELDENGELKGVVFPRNGYFDSALTECGPPALLTDKGILLLYNGKTGLTTNVTLASLPAPTRQDNFFLMPIIPERSSVVWTYLSSVLWIISRKRTVQRRNRIHRRSGVF